MGRLREGHPENNRESFFMKGDKYSLSEIRIQSEQVESYWRLSLLHPHVRWRDF